MPDLTVPGILATATGALATAVGKLWLDQRTKDKEHAKEVEELQDEIKELLKSRLRDQELFLKALERKRSESSRPSVPRYLTETG